MVDISSILTSPHPTELMELRDRISALCRYWVQMPAVIKPTGDPELTPTEAKVLRGEIIDELKPMLIATGDHITSYLQVLGDVK